MILIESILGNIKRDRCWQERLAHTSPDILELSQWEAQKSRCRKTTRGGLEIGLSLPRDRLLNDGDILVWNADIRQAVVVSIQLRDVMVIRMDGLHARNVAEIIKISFDLGHALGNQHWKAVIKDNLVFIPLTVSPHVMESVIKTHGFIICLTCSNAGKACFLK
ncbi:urease accessory protein UreE [Apirhabdus apintestini]|nr:urease accessory protein UreE [Enterobacteriaceae bacterium CA-0114]